MDGDGVEPDRLLQRLVTLQKVHARLHAVEQKTLAELAAQPLPSCLNSHDKQYVVDEVAAVLRLSPRTAGDRVTTAQDLVHRYPATLEALSRGELTLDHARALSDEALGPSGGCVRITATTGWPRSGRCSRPRMPRR